MPHERHYVTIVKLHKRRMAHSLTFMHKQTGNLSILKTKKVNTRLHSAPVFNTYKPNNERDIANTLYSGAITWNALDAKYRDMNIECFKLYQKQQLIRFYQGE